MVQKTRVCIWDSDGSSRERSAKVLNNLEGYQAVEYRNGGGGVGDLVSLRPQILVVDVDYTLPEPEKLLGELRSSLPQLKLIALSRQWDEANRRRFAGSGFDSYLLKPLEAESFLKAVGNINGRRQHLCDVLSFFSPKGKSGRTTMLINLAMCLAQTSGERVAIIDAETNFADVDAFLNLNPRSTIVEALRDLPYLTAGTVERYFEEVNDRVMVLCGARTPQQAAFIDPKGLAGLINLVRGSFRYVLIDLSAGFNETNIAGIEASDKVFLTAMAGEAYVIKHLQRSLEILHSIDDWEKRVTCVITRLEPEVRRRAELEQTLGCPVILLPNEYRLCAEAANNGRMALDMGHGNPLAQEIERWAEAICSEGR